MTEIILHGSKMVGGRAEGEALVSQEPISFIGGLDPLTGIVTEPGHDLEGRNIAGKILIYPTGKGSTGGSYRLYEMAYRHTAPAAVLLCERESVVTLGCIMGDIPAVDRFDRNPCELISDGDHVIVEGETGIVRVYKASN